MSSAWKGALALAVLLALIGGVVIGANLSQPAAAQQGGGGGGPRYTVVETQGHNLLVTDNKSNTLYYYTIDKDEKVGADLKLRGSVDLTQVGKDTIKITKATK